MVYWRTNVDTHFVESWTPTFRMGVHFSDDVGVQRSDRGRSRRRNRGRLLVGVTDWLRPRYRYRRRPRSFIRARERSNPLQYSAIISFNETREGSAE